MKKRFGVRATKAEPGAPSPSTPPQDVSARNSGDPFTDASASSIDSASRFASPSPLPPARGHVATSGVHVASAVRRAVVERDGFRCGYVDVRGVRCEEQAWLEYDHHHPLGKGGTSTLDNMRLLCRAHNRRAAELEYGRALIEGAVARRRRRARCERESSSPEAHEPLEEALERDEGLWNGPRTSPRARGSAGGDRQGAGRSSLGSEVRQQ